MKQLQAILVIIIGHTLALAIKDKCKQHKPDSIICNSVTLYAFARSSGYGPSGDRNEAVVKRGCVFLGWVPLHSVVGC